MGSDTSQSRYRTLALLVSEYDTNFRKFIRKSLAKSLSTSFQRYEKKYVEIINYTHLFTILQIDIFTLAATTLLALSMA